jgi:hypothetical protein
LGIQSGAELIAKAENIVNVLLDENSTPTEFSLQFLNKLFLGVEDSLCLNDTIEITLIRICAKCKKKFIAQANEEICPPCSEESY